MYKDTTTLVFAEGTTSISSFPRKVGLEQDFDWLGCPVAVVGISIRDTSTLMVSVEQSRTLRLAPIAESEKRGAIKG